MGRDASRLLVLAALLVGALGTPVSPAAAAPGYQSAGGFGEPGSADGQFTAPRGAAVTAAGALLVADRDNDRVQVFTPTPTGADYASQFGAGSLDDPASVAVDQATGSVYVSDADEVVKFDSAYAEDATFTHLAVHGRLAVDPTTGDLLVADPTDNTVKRFHADGTPVASGVPAGPFSALLGIAVDATGDVLVIDGTTVQRYAASGGLEATLTGTTQPTAVAVNADDQVLVADSNYSYDSSTMPSARFFDADATEPRANYPLPESSAIWGLIQGAAVDPRTPGRLYLVSDQDRSFGAVKVFAFDETVPVAPTVDNAPAQATGITFDRALLGATVNAGLAETTYFFEYGTDTSYGQRSPSRSAGSAGVDTKVSELVAGLQPQTTYHFRVVADNGIGGPVAGADTTFTTAPAPPTVGAASAVDVTLTGATVLGTVDAHGQSGTYRISVFSTDSPYSAAVGPLDLAALDGPQAVKAVFAGLPAGEAFRVQLSASTNGGDRSGEPFTFATTARPAYVSQRPPAVDGGDPYGCLVSSCEQRSNAEPGKVTPATPSNRFTAKVSVKGATATASVAVPGAGVVKVSGARIRSSTQEAATRGTVKLAATLSPAGRAALRKAKSGRISTALRISYTPVGGKPAVKRVTITFKRGTTR